MNDITRNANQRLKILYLCKILSECTDENHFISMPEIVSKLAMYGIKSERKALYYDMEALRAYGMDIITVKGHTHGYYVAGRDFETPELKLLADAISSSRFLTEKKSKELIKKLEALTSVYEAKQLRRQVYVADRVKSMNEKIYISVDQIHRAIAENKKITFRYFDYGLNKKKIYREGTRTCSPYALAWKDERYYLIAHYEKYNDISNFRVDRMDSVEISEENSEPIPASFNLTDYISSTFSMFSGKAQRVTLRFDNSLVNVVIDRFGKDVVITKDGDEHFTVNVLIKTEQPEPFFGWLFQFGTKAQILEPTELCDKYAEHLKAVLGLIESSR